MNTRQTNRLLGYPTDARLLVINADDFGMCHAINDAALRTLRDGVATSTTLMVPCPWAPHAMHLLRENPDIAFGVHLSATTNADNYRWGPVGAKAPSLVGEAGYFYADERIPEFLAQVRLDELEAEFRAQIDAVLDAQLRPTHLDWHCLADGGRPDIFGLTLGLAREYGLALRIHDQSLAAALQREGLPTVDYGVLDSYGLDTVDKPGQYARMLRELPAGLSEWAVHPGLGNPELQAMEPESWQVRKTDFDFLISHEAHDIVEEEGIVLLSYRALQECWSL